MNNFSDQGHWAPTQYNQYQQWAEKRFIPLTPICIGSSSCRETTLRRWFVFVEKPTGFMERCLQRFVWRIQCTWRRSVPAPCSKKEIPMNSYKQFISEAREAKALLASELPVSQRKKKKVISKRRSNDLSLRGGAS